MRRQNSRSLETYEDQTGPRRLNKPLRAATAMLAGAPCVVSVNGVAMAAPADASETRALPNGCVAVTEGNNKIARCTFGYVGADTQSLSLEGVDEVTVKVWGAGGGGRRAPVDGSDPTVKNGTGGGGPPRLIPPLSRTLLLTLASTAAVTPENLALPSPR